jgi:hypothetical protein
MDPLHKLYKTLDTLTIEPDNTQAVKMSARTDDEAERVQATSGVTMEGLKKKLEDGLGATHVEIEDLSGTLVFLTSQSILLCMKSIALFLNRSFLY